MKGDVRMGIFMIVLILAVVCLSWRLFLLRRSLRRTARELSRITDDLEENRILRLSAPQREMEELLAVINQNLIAIRTQRRVYRTKERQLREQVENISHDLRTPLTAILGYLKLIHRESLTAQDQEYLAIAVRKSHALERLITQFYELSRVSAEDFSLKVAELDGGRILKECVLEQYALFEKAQKKLCLAVPDQKLFVYADQEALERIITNLLQNGIRYAKSTLHISVRPADEEHAVALIFQNDIEAAQRIGDPARLFDRFYMQEESRSKGGSGLGLTISRHLAQGMGGNLEASYEETQSGKQLVLTLTLRGSMDCV